MTGDHIRQRLAEALTEWLDIEIENGPAAAAWLEQTVRDLIADELDAAAREWTDIATGPLEADQSHLWLRDRAAAVRARIEETT